MNSSLARCGVPDAGAGGDPFVGGLDDLSNSKLVSALAGTYAPTPAIETLRPWKLCLARGFEFGFGLGLMRKWGGRGGRETFVGGDEAFDDGLLRPCWTLVHRDPDGVHDGALAGEPCALMTMPLRPRTRAPP